jgi:hypothetical protein
MVRSAAAVAFDGRERSDVKTATRRRRARRKATSTSTSTTSTGTPTVFYSVIRTHARNMSKVAAVLQKKKKKRFGFSVCGGKGKGRNARSIFDWSLVGVGLGIRLGCVRCRRRSNIAWRRRSAVRDRSRIRGLVCGSCSIAVLVTYSSRQYGRLVVRGRRSTVRGG